MHFRVTLILVAYVLLYPAGVTAQESDPRVEKGTVHGYITDTTPAQLPIVSVQVQIDSRNGHIFETASAETGEFIYRDLPPGNYLINIHKSGYQSRIGKSVSVTNGGVHYVPLTMNKQETIFTQFKNFFKSRELQDGTIQLQIKTQSPQPTPIENVDIRIRDIRLIAESLKNDRDLIDKIKINGTSDENGHFRSDNLPPGLYYVSVSNHDNAHNHVSFSITIEGNRITTASVKFPVPDETPDTDILDAQKTDTKWVIRGKIFDANFQQTPLSDVNVLVSGIDSEESMDALSDANGEYEFVLPPAHYLILLYKKGYKKTISLPELNAESMQTSITIIKEGMFVDYQAVAKENVLALKHGMSKEQKTFFQKHGDVIHTGLPSAIIAAMFGYFLVKFLQGRRQE